MIQNPAFKRPWIAARQHSDRGSNRLGLVYKLLPALHDVFGEFQITKLLSEAITGFFKRFFVPMKISTNGFSYDLYLIRLPQCAWSR